jgi:hypothetical protein
MRGDRLLNMKVQTGLYSETCTVSGPGANCSSKSQPLLHAKASSPAWHRQPCAGLMDSDHKCSV